MEKLWASVAVNTSDADSVKTSRFSLSLNFSKIIRDRFPYVEVRGTMKDGLTLYAAQAAGHGNRKLVLRNNAASDEVALPIAFAGVPIVNCTHRLSAICKLTEIEGVAAIEFEPLDVRELPRRDPVSKGRQVNGELFNPPRVVAKARNLVDDELAQLKRSVELVNSAFGVNSPTGESVLERRKTLWAAVICIYKLGPKHDLQLYVADDNFKAKIVVERDL